MNYESKAVSPTTQVGNGFVMVCSGNHCANMMMSEYTIPIQNTLRMIPKTSDRVTVIVNRRNSGEVYTYLKDRNAWFRTGTTSGSNV